MRGITGYNYYMEAVLKQKQKLNLDPFKRFAITRSPFFTEIMTLWRAIGGNFSKRGFYMSHVKRLDPNISQRQWEYFVDNLPEAINQHLVEAVTTAGPTVPHEEEMEKKALNNMLKVAGITLEQIANNPVILLSLPIKDRIKFLETAMKNRNARALVRLKERDDNRKQSLFEDLLEGAQYGGVTEENLLPQEAVQIVDEVPVPELISEDIPIDEQEPIRNELPENN